MAGDYVDEYIATFEVSARRANVKLDNPANIRMFAQGLPRGLAEQCIDIKSPDTFAQWARTAQRQQMNWMRKQSIQYDDYENTVSNTVEKNQPKSTKRRGWKCALEKPGAHGEPPPNPRPPLA
jgi:hypothetical protein